MFVLERRSAKRKQVRELGRSRILTLSLRPETYGWHSAVGRGEGARGASLGLWSRDTKVRYSIEMSKAEARQMLRILALALTEDAETPGGMSTHVIGASAEEVAASWGERGGLSAALDQAKLNQAYQVNQEKLADHEEHPQ